MRRLIKLKLYSTICTICFATVYISHNLTNRPLFKKYYVTRRFFFFVFDKTETVNNYFYTKFCEVANTKNT